MLTSGSGTLLGPQRAMLPPPPRKRPSGDSGVASASPRRNDSTLTDDDIQSFLEPNYFAPSYQYGSNLGRELEGLGRDPTPTSTAGSSEGGTPTSTPPVGPDTSPLLGPTTALPPAMVSAAESGRSLVLETTARPRETQLRPIGGAAAEGALADKSSGDQDATEETNPKKPRTGAADSEPKTVP